MFAAAWCPSCAHYSPLLLSFYEGVNAEKKAIEIGGLMAVWVCDAFPCLRPRRLTCGLLAAVMQ